MNILIVGGTGLTGATAARYLHGKGHRITLMARSAPRQPRLQCYDFIQANYIEDTIDPLLLKGFDGLVFAAGADIRMLPPGQDEDDFYTRANTDAIPRFFAAAKQAGIARCVYIGTYYPQVVPDKVETSAYVRSRHLADQAIRAMSDEQFQVCSLNAPFILGHFPGIYAPHLEALVQYAAGRLPGVPLLAPAGGVNHISVISLAEAIDGALQRGAGGKAYLVGDQNLSWKTYFEWFCECAGNAQILEVTRDEHPLLPDTILYAGRNATISYHADNAPLNYRQGLIRQTIQEVVGGYL